MRSVQVRETRQMRMPLLAELVSNGVAVSGVRDRSMGARSRSWQSAIPPMACCDQLPGAAIWRLTVSWASTIRRIGGPLPLQHRCPRRPYQRLLGLCPQPCRCAGDRVLIHRYFPNMGCRMTSHGKLRSEDWSNLRAQPTRSPAANEAANDPAADAL